MTSPRQTIEWTSERVAETYLEFFRSRGHLQLPSSSLVPENDPTVLLTTAGMQQMIPYMLGRAEPPSRRLCSVQKCFRTTDIDSVGDRAHLTFFEMLGNFSIGDYFKAEMVPMAWELVTQGFSIPEDRLWVTVHPTDDAAPGLWRSVGVPEDRIVEDESNFWGPPGASGPCGPDTEIYVDRGASFPCERDVCLGPLCECERYLEIWNLVFMQFFQDTDGKRAPLERTNIDTGAGLERITSVLQNTPSVYETDLFLPIINGAGELAGRLYGTDEPSDYALRVLADHGRAMVFLIGDGVLPGNEGRGYVLRRIMRRAIRYGKKLALDRPFLAELGDLVIDRMAGRYPTLAATRAHITQILRTEESRFLSTLQAGLNLLDRSIDEARGRGARQLSGERIFRLYDTYGFPKEISEEIVGEAGLSIDWEEYDRAMAAQRLRSRGAAKFDATREVGRASEVLAQPPTIFLGYTRTQAPSKVLAVQRDAADAPRLTPGDSGAIVLAETPFYAESGGQVGDTGEIVTQDGRFVVEDTQRDGAGHFLHIGHVERGEFEPGQPVDAIVDTQRRGDVMRHHSGTHLLHKSLRLVLGDQAMQAGSLVAPQVARFDFPHEGPVESDQLEEVEDIINREILADVPVVVDEMHFQQAIDLGAMAMFGEKYGDRVRVVSIDDFSRELCGGTHVGRTGELGAAYIVSESGIGSGMRRVELVAGRAAYEYARARNRQIASIAEVLSSSPGRVVESAEALEKELREERRRREHLEDALAKARTNLRLSSDQLKELVAEMNQPRPRLATDIIAAERLAEGVPMIVARFDAESTDSILKEMDPLRESFSSGVILFGGLAEGKPQFVASVSPDLVSRGYDAVSIVRAAASATGGGGGGKPELARAGGRPERAGDITDALELAAQTLRDAHPSTST